MCKSNNKTICPPGTYQPYRGRTACNRASCGYYVAEPGSVSQLACTHGLYQPKTGSTGCLKAPRGHYVSSNGWCRTYPCPAGQFQDCKGQASCKVTPCGHYAPKSGSPTAIKCPLGMYTPYQRQTSCYTTQRGYFSPQGSCNQHQCRRLLGLTFDWACFVLGVLFCCQLGHINPDSSKGDAWKHLVATSCRHRERHLRLRARMENTSPRWGSLRVWMYLRGTFPRKTGAS